MADAYKIEINKRNWLGKRDVKLNRREGKIPGVFYSADSKESIPLFIDETEFIQVLKSKSHLYQIKVGSKLRNVIFKEVQYHPVTDEVLHIDLYGVSLTDKIDLKVPLHLMGEPIGVSEEGGHLTQSMMDVEIRCLPTEIPDFIEMDVSELNLNESVYVSSIPVPENVEITSSEELVVASISHGISEEDLVTEVAEEDEFTFEEGEEGEEGKDGEESDGEKTSAEEKGSPE